MSAQDFLRFISELIYLAMFVVTASALLRTRTMAALDTFLLFGTIAFLLLIGNAAELMGLDANPVIGGLTWIGIAALPYLLLRLVDAFQPQPHWLMRLAPVELVGISVVGVVQPQPWPVQISLLVVIHFVVLGGYSTAAFLVGARRAQGLTRRRMQAVALGSGLLALIILMAGVQLVMPSIAPVVGLLNQILSLAAVAAYYVGFAPPAVLRRAWLEPILRDLLGDAADLVQLPDPRAITKRIEASALEATGGQGATVGLWDATNGHLVYLDRFGETAYLAPGDGIGGRAFAWQRPVYTHRAERDAPERAGEYRRHGVRSVAAAPITSGDRRIGVLVVYAARPPAFTEDVLALVSLLADEAALVLHSHELLREAAQVQAHAEMTRLKDDFLSVVAHDVRTPLTTILINAELLQKELTAGRNGKRALALRNEAGRLKTLVEDYLDIVSIEGRRKVRLTRCDLMAIVKEAVEGIPDAESRVEIIGEEGVLGQFDAARIRQLVHNLVGNALKYSDEGARVEVRVMAGEAGAELTVRDRGIGIPEEDLPQLFERFHRGRNTDDRQYAGLGLGLYICRQIVEEHGGTITVSSRIGEGTTFCVSLPLEQIAGTST